MRAYPFILSVIILVACGQNNDNIFDAPVRNAKAIEQGSVKGERTCLSGDTIGNISGIYANDSILLLKGVEADSPFLIHVFSTNDDSAVGNFVAKGRGEGELLAPIIKGCQQKKDRSIYLFDLNLCAAFSLDIKKSVESQKTDLLLLLKLPPQTLDAYPIGEDHIALVPQKDDYICEILDRNGDQIKKISLFPNVPGSDYFEGLSSACVVNQDRRMLAMAMCMLPQVNILDITTGEKSTVAISKDYKNWHKILNDSNDERRIYYTAITQSDKNIIALCMDSAFEEWIKGTKAPHLHIFDWEGNFLNDVTIQENLKTISFDDSTQILYGVDTNDSVFKYDLSDIINGKA